MCSDICAKKYFKQVKLRHILYDNILDSKFSNIFSMELKSA